MKNTIDRERIEYIDALRAVAAISVLIVHIGGYLSRQPDATWFALGFKEYVLNNFDLGLFGVAIFFYISGFVIPPSLLKINNLSQFWFHRILRLYPIYWISLLAVLIADSVFLNREFAVTQVIANITMTPQLFGEKPMSGVYWTLFVEILFYLALSVLLPTGLLRNSNFIAFAVVMLISLTAIPIFINRYLHTALPVTFIAFHLSYLFAGLLVRLTIYEKTNPQYKLLFGTLFLQFILSVIATDALYIGTPRFGLFSNHANLFAYTLATIVFILSVNNKAPNSNLLLRVGKSSFSLYVLHWPIIIILIGLLSPIQSQLNLLVLIFGAVISLGIAELSYRYIECYFIRVGKYGWTKISGPRKLKSSEAS